MSDQRQIPTSYGMELLVTIAKGFQQLTIAKNNPNLRIIIVLNQPLQIVTKACFFELLVFSAD